MSIFRRRIIWTGVIAAGVLIAACSQKPDPIHLNSDECVHCKMMITDPRFASQVVTEKGKSFKFDAIECMADFVIQKQPDHELSGAKLWVSDFNDPDNWIQLEVAVFVKSKEIQSPMGESLLAFGNRREAENHLAQYPGRIITWKEIKGEN